MTSLPGPEESSTSLSLVMSLRRNGKDISQSVEIPLTLLRSMKLTISVTPQQTVHGLYLGITIEDSVHGLLKSGGLLEH